MGMAHMGDGYAAIGDGGGYIRIVCQFLQQGKGAGLQGIKLYFFYKGHGSVLLRCAV
jgi:hypothetical protein